MNGFVVAVARDGEHRFSKQLADEVRILPGLGVQGDAHQGSTVRHRSRVAADAAQANLRQVHLIHAELFDELREKGFDVGPGDLGENVATRGLDLLKLPRGTLLKLGAEVELEVTGLRNPCIQIERFMPGLLNAVLEKAQSGELIRKTGIMTIARTGGMVRPGDRIQAVVPPPPHMQLDCV